MDARRFGVVSFALAVTPALGAQAAHAQEPAVPVANSYSDLLEPIPDATERLKLADLQAAAAPAHLIRAEWGEGRAHHHHHHHHHHNNYYGAPYYSPYYSPYYGSAYSPYYTQPYGYTVYYGGGYYRRDVRRHHHHHHQQRHHHHHYR